MKKRALIVSVAMLLGVGLTAFVGCGIGGDNSSSDEAVKEQKVMNVALNPEVEFILDTENKVVSVNALNEEGNLIVSAEAFVNVEGKSAEEAAKLFAQVAKDTGFLIEGNINAGENEIKISLSGDEEASKTLYNAVQGEVAAYLDSVDITATIGYTATMTEEQLRALVAECAPYLETAEMEYAELVNALAESRKETAEFYSQELKNAYYEAKAFAMEQAEMEAIVEQIGGATKLMYDVASAAYTTAVDLIESTRMSMLVNEDSPYQVALAAFRDAKADYLAYRNEIAAMDPETVTQEMTDRLAQYDALVEQTETNLTNAGVQGNAALDSAKAQAKTAYDTIVAQIGEYSTKATTYATEISEKRKSAQTEFFTKFETDYAAAKSAAQQNWQNMQNKLEGEEAPQE